MSQHLPTGASPKMRFSMAALLLGGALPARAATETDYADLTVTSGSSKTYYSVSTNIDNGIASQSVTTIPLPAPSEASDKSISNAPANPRPTDDFASTQHVSPFSETADPNTVITGKTIGDASGGSGPSTTITGKPSTTDFSELGCTQFTTVSGAVSPLCVVQPTTVRTSEWVSNTGHSKSSVSARSTVKSSPSVELPHLPTEASTEYHSSKTSPNASRYEPSSTDPVPIQPTQEPHPDLTSSQTRQTSSHYKTSSSQTMLPPPPSWTEVPNPIPHTVWFNYSSTFVTSTRKPWLSFDPVNSSTAHVHSHTKPGHTSETHSHSLPHDHSESLAESQSTNTRTLTRTVPASHSVTPTAPALMTVWVTVTASETKHGPTHETSRSHCEDKTIAETVTDRVTVTEHNAVSSGVLSPSKV